MPHRLKQLALCHVLGVLAALLWLLGQHQAAAALLGAAGVASLICIGLWRRASAGGRAAAMGALW